MNLDKWRANPLGYIRHNFKIKEMKTLRYFIATIIIVMAISININAQDKNESVIPQVIISAFNNKYPNTEVKRWKIEDDRFIAKAIIKNSKSFAAFDKNGKWLNTVTKITWPWKLPKAVNAALNKTKYGNWHVYSMAKLERPSGNFYRIIVDDGNLTADPTRQFPLATDKLLEFKTDGTLINVVEINNPLAYASGPDQGR
jgi:hypothetical protein